MFDFPPADDPFAQVLRTRRTVNSYHPELPPPELILQGIELARWAPNHKMTEPWRFHLLGPETSQQVIALNTALLTIEKGPEAAQKKRERWLQIPGWAVVTCRISPDALRNEENYAAVACAIQNLMLFLWSRGVGTKWSTSAVLQLPQFADLLNLDLASERVVGLIWYGYPALLSETKRRSVADITIIHP